MRATFILPVFAMALGIAGCSDPCGNEVVRRVDSPDGTLKAVLFQRDCGATTGFSSQLSVLKAGASVSGSGNAFRADDDHGAAVAADWGGPRVEVRWLAANRLLIRYDAKARVFEANEDVSGVAVTYEKVRR